MARPLTGRVTVRGGRFQASVPAQRGGARRHYEVFDTKAQADAWCRLAVANLTAGIPLPSRDAVLADADPSRRTRKASAAFRGSNPRVQHTVAQVTDAWFHEVYLDGRSGGAERANTVRAMLNRRVVPFLSPIFDAGNHLTRDAYRTYLGELGRPSAVHAEYRRGPRTPEGLGQDTLADVRRCLDAVIRLGVSMGAWELSFNLADVRTPRSRRKSPPKAASVSLGDVAQIAGHMHVVHQIPLWICRILTLRVGEAYGIRVADLVPLGDGSGRGLMWLHAQGGKKFRNFDGDRIVRAFHKEGMKNGYSERMQLVPVQLMTLFENVIDVFHTEPDTGRVHASARLIPGLVASDAGGQETFRLALKRAAAEAGVSTVTLNGFERSVLGLPNPKDLRSSAVTDLEWVPGLDPTALRRYAGHAPGTDVHSLHYVVDQPVNEKIVQVCQAMEDLIANELPNGLLIPTAKSCTTGSQPLLAARAHEIDTRLVELGWRVGGGVADDPWLSVEQVADLLGRGLPTVRRWAREGRIEASVGKASGGTHHGHRIRRSTALAFARAEMDRTTLADLEEITGVSYHRLYSWVRRFSLETEPSGARHIYLPTRSVAELRRLIGLERHLQGEGVPFAEAARILSVQSRTIDARVRLGILQETDERGPDGTRYVTRASVQRVLAQPALMTTRRKPRRNR